MKINLQLEFHLEVSYCSGSFTWTSHRYPFTICATPLWESTDGITISVQDVDGGEILGKVIDFSCDDEQKLFWVECDDVRHNHKEFERYLKIMEFELPSLLEEIVHEIN